VNGAVLGANPLAPPPEWGAGSFVFLLEDNINDGPDGVLNPISGRAAGHNIDAPAHGLSADGATLTAPGGTFPSNKMGCTSCHDPHGNTNFRMLYGTGPILGNGESFSNPAPVAVGIDLDGEPESNSNHTAYISGMSAWCATCHTVS
jgi:predicted CXXCH cytochrome family protein